MKKIVCVLISFFGTFLYSQTTKQNKVKELIYLSGNFTLTEKVVGELFSRYKNKYSEVPDSEWKSIEEKIEFNDLINDVAVIYGNKFTDKEIDELLSFYQSELGKKVFHNSPIIKNEIQDVTSSWAIRITKTIDAYLEKKGFKNPEPINSRPATPMLPKK